MNAPAATPVDGIPVDGLPVHRFVAVIQADVQHLSAAEAQAWLLSQLDEIPMDPHDAVHVVSITEVAR